MLTHMVGDSLAVFLLVSVLPPTTNAARNPSQPPLTVENIAAIAGAGKPSRSWLLFWITQ